MSMILNELNKMAFWIAPLFYKLLSMSLTACCIGLVVLLLRKFADKKIAPAWKYALWALMLVALILPYRPQSETAVLPTEPVEQLSYREEYDAVSEKFFVTRQDETADPVVVEKLEEQQESLFRKSLVVDVLLPLGWLGGSITYAVYLLASVLHLKHKLRRNARPCSERSQKILLDCMKQLELYAEAELLVQQELSTPAVMGFWKAAILLPDYAEDMDDEQLRFILLHELAHFKRCDTMVNNLLIGLQAIYWFNPVVAWLFRFLREDMELLNDAYVLKLVGKEQGKAYSLALVEVLTRSSKLPFAPKLLCMCDEGKNIQRRISMIKLTEQFKKNRILIAVGCLILMFVLAMLFLTQSSEKFDNNIYASGTTVEVLPSTEAPEEQNVTVHANQGGTSWMPVSKEEYLSVMDSPEIEAWLENCTDDSKAYALKHNTEYEGLKRVQWLVYFAKHADSEYDTSVDYGWLDNTVKVNFHKIGEADGSMLLRITHTDEASRHKGKLKLYYGGSLIDCEVTEVDYDLNHLDKLLEQLREEQESEIPAAEKLELSFPQETLYAPTGYYQYSQPFTLTMDNPLNWTAQSSGKGTNKLPQGGESFAYTYLCEEGREDAVAYVFAQTFLPNQYEEMQFPNEQYYQTVFPELRLSSFCIWDPFTSVKKTDSGEVGTCDIWFHDRDYIKQNKSVSMAAVPNFESKGILAYDNNIKVYVGIGFASDYEISEEELRQLAESIVLTSTTKNTQLGKAVLPAISEQEFTRNFEIFEKYFLGYWSDDNGTVGLNYEDSSLVEWMGYLGEAEDEENVYLLYLGGGTGQLFRIAKDEPDVLYFYSDWQSNPEYSMSYIPQVYRRAESEIKLSTDVTQPSPKSLMARAKLFSLYGIRLDAVGSQVTLEDGSQWEATYTIEMPLERFWLVEPATEDKVVFVRQLFNANGVKRDIRIEARKQDDSWTVTDAQVQSYSQPMIRIE